LKKGSWGKILIKKILVAIDGSEQAERALLWGLELAERFNSKVLLVSVAEPVVVPLAPSVTMNPMQAAVIPPDAIDSHKRELKARHMQVLSDSCERAKMNKPNVYVEIRLEVGSPANKIIEAAREGNFDIIVMGNRGLGGIKQLLLGSVSKKVADEAHCPVLIVK